MNDEMRKEYRDIDEELSDLVGYASGLLIKNKLKIGFSESATGGLLSKLFTDRPGISACYNGSVCAYSDSVKNKILGVSNKAIEQFGAVSGLVAQQMAVGGRRALGVDICMSETGIAGPGGSEYKPEGLFFFGFSYTGEAESRMSVFSGSRDEIRKMAAKDVLIWLCEKLEAISSKEIL